MEMVGRFPSLNVFSGPMGQGLSSDAPFRPDGLLNKKFDIACIYRRVRLSALCVLSSLAWTVVHCDFAKTALPSTNRWKKEKSDFCGKSKGSC